MFLISYYDTVYLFWGDEQRDKPATQFGPGSPTMWSKPLGCPGPRVYEFSSFPGRIH